MATEYERALAAGDIEKGGRFWDSAANFLRRRGTGRQRRVVTTNNGSAANPIKGTQVAGQTELNGGAF